MNPANLDARTAWNTGADAFIAFVDSGADYYRHHVHGPALLAACGAVSGARVLDLGCGHGYFARLLARAGARVTALDLSDNLHAHACAEEARAPLGITYLHMDAAQIGTHFNHASFDLVTGCMSVQDMAEPAAVLAGASRVLHADGRMVFSVPHPCTDPPVREWQRDGNGNKLRLCLDRYFDTGPALCHWSMPRLLYPWSTPYRRFTLTEWSALVNAAGFGIRSLQEPRPTPELVAAHPQLSDCFRMPYFLILELVLTVSREAGE